MFNDKQKEMLNAPLDRSNVAQRKQGNITLSYIEAFYAIDKANEIFGYDGWSYSLVSLNQVSKEEVEVGYSKEEGVEVCYHATVKVKVGEVEREDVGFGSGRSKNPRDAYELAAKEAVTDALKRALRTFGNQFGNCLYDKTQANVTDTKEEKAKTKKVNVNLMELLNKCDSDEMLNQFRKDYMKLIQKSDNREEIKARYIELKNKFKSE